MDKLETEILATLAIGIHVQCIALEKLHKIITDLIIQKGEPNVKPPGNTDYRRN